MKIIAVVFVTMLGPLASVYAEKTCSCEIDTGVVPAAATSTVSDRHPLKGVITDVFAEKSALLVKHEEIPGVMKAMTMLLKVDADALKSVNKGDAVTGLLVRKADGWWLEEVKVIQAPK